MATKLIRLPEVFARTGLRKSAIYARIKNGDFPSPVRIGTRSVAFREEEIEQWIEGLPRGLGESNAIVK